MNDIKNLEEEKEIAEGKDLRVLLSANLKWFRSLQNISQAALASKVGLTHNFINDIENCKRWTSPQTIAKLALVLGVEPYQLFLPELKNGDPRSYSFNRYLEDFSNSLDAMQRELREKYLQDDNAESQNRVNPEKE